MSKTPDQVTGLKLWLKGGVGLYQTTDTSTPVTANGQSVGRWEDQSGQGSHVTQATSGSRPIYQSAGTNGLDTHASTLGDRTDDALTNSTALQFSGKTGMTLFAVVHQTNQSGSVNYGIAARDASGNRGWLASADFSTGKAVWIISSSSTVRVRRDGSKIDLRGLPCLIACRFNGSASEMSIRVNGVDDTGAIDAAVPATIGGNGAALQILNDGFTEPFGGHIAELAIYDVSVSDADRTDLEAYFLARYRLTSILEGAASPDIACHQGYTWDGTKHYTLDTAKIQRRTDDVSWTIEATNSSPFTGISGSPTHIGDGSYYNGKLYLPLEIWPGSCPPNAGSMKLGVYDATTLALDSATDVSAQGHEVSGVAVDPYNGWLWVASFCDGTKLWKYKLSDRSFIASLSLSETIDSIQGLVYRQGVLWATTGTGTTGVLLGRLLRIDPATGTVRAVYHDARRSISTSHEGLGFHAASDLRWLIDESTGTSGSKFVHTFALSYPSVMVAPTASVTSSGPTTANLSATAATGGVSSYIYQWQRSIDVGATYSDVSGATSTTLADTGLTSGVTYYYRLRATDSDNPPSIVLSGAVVAVATIINSAALLCMM